MSSIFFKGEYDYTEYTRNVDNMIEQFAMDREKVVKLLENDSFDLSERLWSDMSPICKDDTCLFNMGRHIRRSVDDLLNNISDTTESMINYYVCPQCKNMKRLIDFSKTRNGEPFYIECGSKVGS